MFPHKYVKLYETEEDYEQALNNHELEEVAVSAIIGDRTETPDRYLYSIRTTNNDNERLGPFNQEDPIKYFGGLEIIWGYWGWKWEDAEYNGETLHGGHFIDLKNTTKYPDILDGYRLLHIDNLVELTPNILQIGYFDASNIVSASSAFNRSTINHIGTGYFPKLKNCSNMFRNISKDIIGDTLYIPLIETGPLISGQASNVILQQGFKIHINSNPVQIYSSNSIVFLESDVNLFDYFENIDNLYDLSNFYTNYINILNGAIFKFKPKYKGSETIILPQLYLKSNYLTKLEIDKPFSMKDGYTLFLGNNVVFFEKALIPNNLFTDLIVPGDFIVFQRCKFTSLHPPVVFNNITYGEVYYLCDFEEPIIFDCTLLKELPNVSPFNYCSGPKLTLNNIPDGDNVILLTDILNFRESILDIKDESNYRTFSVKANTSLINKTINTKEYISYVDLNNCTITIKNPEFETGGHDDITLSNEIRDCVFNTYYIRRIYIGNIYSTLFNITSNNSGYSFELSGSPNEKLGDYSDLTFNFIYNTSTNININILDMIKSPIFKSLSGSENVVIFRLPLNIEYFYAEHFNNPNNGFNIPASSHKSIKELHFGDGIRELSINLCQDIDIDVLMLSLSRLTTNSTLTRRLNINRIPWNKLSEDLILIIRNLFLTITITENE